MMIKGIRSSFRSRFLQRECMRTLVSFDSRTARDCGALRPQVRRFSFEASAAIGNMHDRTRPVQLSGIRHDGSTVRFYRETGVRRVADGTYAPTINGRLITTAAGHVVAVPTHVLARAISLEWSSQRNRIVPGTMPLSYLAVNAIDLIRPSPTAREDYMKHFDGATHYDTLRIRSSYPSGLVNLQKRLGDPILKHVQDKYAIQLTTTTDFEVPPLSPETIAAARSLLNSYDDWTLSALDQASTVTKSIAIAISLVDGSISPAEASDASRTEENYQIKKYGKVDGLYGHQVDIDYSLYQLAAIQAFLILKNVENDLVFPDYEEDEMIIDTTATTTTSSLSSSTLTSNQ